MFLFILFHYILFFLSLSNYLSTWVCQNIVLHLHVIYSYYGLVIVFLLLNSLWLDYPWFASCILDIFTSIFSFWILFILSYNLHITFIRNLSPWVTYILSFFPPLYFDFTFVSLHYIGIVFSSIVLNRAGKLYHSFSFFNRFCFWVILILLFSSPWLLFIFQLLLFPGVLFLLPSIFEIYC